MQIFDYACDFDSARVVYVPVPFEATVSYRRGSALGPQAMHKASVQLDLDDAEVQAPYKQGLYLLDQDKTLITLNKKTTKQVDDYRKKPFNAKLLAAINKNSHTLNTAVYKQTKSLLKQGKIVGILGGDHSVPYGAIQATTEHFGKLGILHFDAHHDLREAYQGFTHSHASIMHNVLKDFSKVTKLTQVGIRDFCEEEKNFAKSQGTRVSVFYDHELKRQLMLGKSWHSMAKKIVSTLPQTVYVSFDIDGLDPKLCPNTGTPVVGGLNFHEANHILREVVLSGRKIVGFDLVEVAPGKSDDWDANVGMRLLYKLTAWTLASQRLAKIL